MSLSISPQGFVAGFNPKAYQIIAPPKEVSSNEEVNTDSTNPDVRVDLSHLEIVKIIPEGEPNGGPSNGSPGNNETTIKVNVDPDKLVEKIISPETGEGVRETTMDESTEIHSSHS